MGWAGDKGSLPLSSETLCLTKAWLVSVHQLPEGLGS